MIPLEELGRLLNISDAVSHWDDLTGQWMAETGTWTVRVGVDAQTFVGAETFEVGSSMPWIGL